MTKTGNKIKVKGKRIIVESEKYNSDPAYSKEINDTLSDMFKKMGEIKEEFFDYLNETFPVPCPRCKGMMNPNDEFCVSCDTIIRWELNQDDLPF